MVLVPVTVAVIVLLALLVGWRVNDAMGVGVAVELGSLVDVARLVGGGMGVMVCVTVFVAFGTGVRVAAGISVACGGLVGSAVAWAQPARSNSTTNPEKQVCADFMIFSLYCL